MTAGAVQMVLFVRMILLMHSVFLHQPSVFELLVSNPLALLDAERLLRGKASLKHLLLCSLCGRMWTQNTIRKCRKIILNLFILPHWLIHFLNDPFCFRCVISTFFIYFPLINFQLIIVNWMYYYLQLICLPQIIAQTASTVSLPKLCHTCHYLICVSVS